MAGVRSGAASTARRHRLLDTLVGCSFALGGVLFALGALMAQQGTAGLTTVNVTP